MRQRQNKPSNQLSIRPTVAKHLAEEESVLLRLRVRLCIMENVAQRFRVFCVK